MSWKFDRECELEGEQRERELREVRPNPHGWQLTCLMCGCPESGDKRCGFDCACHEEPVKAKEGQGK